ncbi:hypothetical protein [Yunchengibacter salinarum]|uniref:hypothetical protein n=1 Tax=Yunchengibacter salinarum TaxID=3133399 RepID=UPI0035B5DABF
MTPRQSLIHVGIHRLNRRHLAGLALLLMPSLMVDDAPRPDDPQSGMRHEHTGHRVPTPDFIPGTIPPDPQKRGRA